MTWRGWLGWAFVGTVALLLTYQDVYDAATHPGLARYCAGGAPPRTWFGEARKPAWVTPARIDLLCAVTAWLRDETGWRVRDPEDTP